MVIFIFWYFAGMFRQFELMTAALCIAVLTILLTILAIYQKRRLSLRLKKTRDIAFKKVEKEIAVLAENKSALPVNRFQVRLRLRYMTDRKATRKKYIGCAGSKKMNEENFSSFYLYAPLCGILEISLLRLTVFDPLSVFSSGKKLRESGQLLVFPIEKPMQIILPSSGSHDNIPLTDTSTPKKGDDHSEVRLIREYREGDLLRHIHQNYSAKTDSLYVKEFSRENDFILDLLLDTSFSDTTTEDWDAFYEIIFSVMTSMLRLEYTLNVFYFDRSRNGLMEFRVSDSADCAELMAQLYLADKKCTHEELYGNSDLHRTDLMVINTHAEWFCAGKPIYRFHKELVEKELSSVVFRL